MRDLVVLIELCVLFTRKNNQIAYLQALGLNGRNFNGHSIVVQPLRRGEFPDKSIAHELTLKVENVPDYISKSKYEDLFRPFGSMKCIKLENKSVLVTFNNGYKAQEAMHELNGIHWEARFIRLTALVESQSDPQY